MRDLNLNERKAGFDWPLLISTAALMVLGVAFIFSATGNADAAGGKQWYQCLWFHQVAWYFLGVVAAVALSPVAYGKLARWSDVVYWVAVVSLVVVFLIGTVHLGGKRWVNVGFGFSLQPSEFAKIAFILWMAGYLSRPVEELSQTRVFLTALGGTVVPFVLILKEPDLGSALVFLPVSLVMMYVAGVPNHLLARVVGGAGLVVVFLVGAILFAPTKFKIVESYQRDRLLTYFGPKFAERRLTTEDRKELRERSYNVEQSLISVGSGGFWGKGWRQGTQYSLGFLPKAGAHNDFIFSVIAEQEGFVGSVVILTLYTVLLFSGIKIASQARDRLGQLLAVGVVTLLFSHVFVNIGMNIRIMPVTGIPLPLLSYGGSSVICSLIAIGILHNVHLHRRYY